MTNAVLRELYRSVLTKRELSSAAKLLVLKSVFIAIIICAHESWVMTEKILYKGKTAEMGFLRRVHDVKRHDSCEIRKTLNVETFLILIDICQLRLFGYVSRISQKRLLKHFVLATPLGKRPRG